MFKLMNANDIIIHGIGNPLVSDDRIGLFLAENIGNEFNIPYTLHQHLSLDLVESFDSTRKNVIIDSFKMDKYSIGQIVEFNLEQLKYQDNPTYTHGLTIPILINLYSKLNEDKINNLSILGVNIKDNYTISEDFSDAISKNLNDIVNRMKQLIFNPELG